jgi:hypothetical protein
MSQLAHKLFGKGQDNEDLRQNRPQRHYRNKCDTKRVSYTRLEKDNGFSSGLWQYYVSSYKTSTSVMITQTHISVTKCRNVFSLMRMLILWMHKLQPWRLAARPTEFSTAIQTTSRSSFSGKVNGARFLHTANDLTTSNELQKLKRQLTFQLNCITQTLLLERWPTKRFTNCWNISMTTFYDFRQYSVWLRAGRSGFDSRQGQRIFLLASASRPALGPTQPPIQWVPGVLSPGIKRGRGVTLTTHLHIVPRLSISRSCTSSPPMCLHGM